MKAPVKAVVNIMYTGNVLEAMSNASLRQFGLSAQQYNILRILKGSMPDAMTVMDIKSRMLDKTPNMTRLMDKLHEKNLINRERSKADRRAMLISLSESGEELLDEVHSAGPLHKGLGELTEGEYKILSALLDKLRND